MNRLSFRPSVLLAAFWLLMAATTIACSDLSLTRVDDPYGQQPPWLRADDALVVASYDNVVAELAASDSDICNDVPDTSMCLAPLKNQFGYCSQKPFCNMDERRFRGALCMKRVFGEKALRGTGGALDLQGTLPPIPVTAPGTAPSSPSSGSPRRSPVTRPCRAPIRAAARLQARHSVRPYQDSPT